MQPLYDSPWHNPAFVYLCGLVFLVVLARKLPFLYGFLVLCAVEILADATVTGGWSPAAGSRALEPLAILFVILGDARFFFLIERYSRPAARRGAKMWLCALGFSLIVPILSQVVLPFVPHHQDSRVVFLTYEILFFVLALVIAMTLSRRLRDVSRPIARWLRELVWFELGQYGLWMLADVIILSGRESGYLLRLLPNIAYYTCFLPFVLWRAPTEART